MRLTVLLFAPAMLPLAAASMARADVPSLELVWEAPEDCPRREAIDAAIRRLVRVEGRDRIKAEVRIEAHASSYRAHLDMNGGQRELAAESCHAVAEAVVVLVALAIDPSASERADDPRGALPDVGPAAASTPAEEASSGSPPETGALPANASGPGGRPPPRDPPTTRETAEPRSGASPRERVRLEPRVDVAGALDIGTLPRPSAGIGALFGVDGARFGLGLGGTWLIPRDETIDGTTSGASFDFVAARLDACFALIRRPVRGDLCASAEAGILAGRPFGIEHPEPRSRAWAALGPEASLRVPAGPQLSWLVRGGPQFPLTRHRYGIDELGAVEGMWLVHRPAAVVGRAEVGLVLSL